MPRGRKPKDDEEEDDNERFTASRSNRLKQITARFLALLKKEANERE